MAPATQSATANTCPLCGADRPRRRVEVFSFREIWAALAAQWEAQIPEGVASRLTPGPETALVPCGTCGLRYFSPALPGDGPFYEALAASPRYYSPWKWEFGLVGGWLGPGDAVLDVGCGAGDFLAAVAPRVRLAVGLETNEAAASAAGARGLAVAVAPLETFAAEREGSFDAVTILHVVEHLQEVRQHLRAAVRCLRPGGALYVSVPNRRRFSRQRLEPLDCPPHHLSRWAPRQLAWLAAALDLRLVGIAFEPADPAMVHFELQRRLMARLERIPAAGESLGRWSARIVERTIFHRRFLRGYERMRLFDRVGFRGMSMVARMVRPPSGGRMQ